MGWLASAVRGAVNPLSTRATMLVQNRGFRRGAVPMSGRRGRKVTRSLQQRGPIALARVPDMIGLPWHDARDVLHRSRLVAIAPDPDGPPLAALGRPGAVVIDQDPEAGTLRPLGSPVTLWIDGGPGSGGVREPRRPRPTARTASGMLDEESGEAIG